jgi:hypothetical protein
LCAFTNPGERAGPPVFLFDEFGGGGGGRRGASYRVFANSPIEPH